MAHTMAELIAMVPPGEERTFEPSLVADRSADRFFRVLPSNKYRSHLMIWDEPSDLSKRPFSGERRRAAVSIDAVAEYGLTYEGAPSRIVDFYGKPDVYFLSDRLVTLFDAMDPDAIVTRPARAVTRDGELSFNAVLPARVIEAVDVEASVIRIEQMLLGSSGYYQTLIPYPEGPVFRTDISADVHALKDFDSPFWYWSGELLREAKRRRIRGLYGKALVERGGEYIFL